MYLLSRCFSPPFSLFLLQFYHVSFHVASCILFAPSLYSAGKRCLAGREEARQHSAVAGVLPAAESPPKPLPVCLYMQTCLFYPFFLPSLFGYFILSSTLCFPAICLPSHQIILKGNTVLNLPCTTWLLIWDKAFQDRDIARQLLFLPACNSPSLAMLEIIAGSEWDRDRRI